jgi:hypothetical protein
LIVAAKKKTEMSPFDARDEFLKTLAHVGDVLTKVVAQTGSQGLLVDVDLQTIAEGLFLYAFTNWEQFTRDLLIEDLATSPSSMLLREVQQFTDSDAPSRLAARLLKHPDHPQRFIEWSNYADIVSRANEFLGAGNRFAVTPLPRRSDLELLKRVRNAVAHRSDKAWTSFLNLCEDPPFNVPASEIVGMTPGRFLISYQWNGQPVLRDTLSLLEAAARHLVPLSVPVEE